MRISSLEELQHYVSNTKLTAPKFEIDAWQIILIPHLVHYGIIVDIFLLSVSAILIQKTENMTAITMIALFVLMLYSLWFDYNAINKVEIDFDNDQIVVKYRSPFRLLLFFMDQHRQRSFSISSLNGFFYRGTARAASFKRFRLYAERKDQPDILLIDFPSEEHAAKVVDYLNKAMKEVAKKAHR
jgi:hypothetical protein